MAMAALLATALMVEGPTTIPFGSRAQASSKRGAPHVGGDMVWSPVKAGEGARQRRVRNAASKEALYDTEGWNDGVAMPAQIQLFVNFGQFNTAGLGLQKAFGRDTNLQGQNGLPAAHHHYWYGWRLKIRTLDAVLSNAANVVVPEEINRARELSFCQFRFSASELITCQADELPNGTGPAFIQTTHAGATVMSLPSGVPDRKNHKDVTISGRPVEIIALENFRLVVGTPVGFTPTEELYATMILEGLLLRGLT